jgi:putative tryptophan/tyrosine transport system substrate-binding protein
MRRREFITLVGSAAAAWPLAARAQQRERMRRIGVLMTYAADDRAAQTRLTVFLQQMQQLGWSEGRNLHSEVRWGEDAQRIQKAAAELVALAPDVALVAGSPAAGPLLQATRTLPIVFVQVADPVGAGFVQSLSHPGGNATGFSNFEYGTSAKWLDLLKQIAPQLSRVAVLRDPNVASGAGQLGAIQTAAASLGVELSPVNITRPDETERAVAAFAAVPHGGLIVTAGGAARAHHELIIALAARHRLPAIYSDRVFVTAGGLIGYGPDRVDQFRRAAGYVDRILKGEKPADLPVQAPTKFELVINVKTAKSLGIDIPPTLLVLADEVIE